VIKIKLPPGCLSTICWCPPKRKIVLLFPTDDGQAQEGTCDKCGTVYSSAKEGVVVK